MTDARNVLGESLAECCTKPMTGFYRDGICNTGPEDVGVHTVCTKVDAAFLAFSKAAGTGVDRSLPTDCENARNAASSLVQTVCTPKSSGPVLQLPSR